MTISARGRQAATVASQTEVDMDKIVTWPTQKIKEAVTRCEKAISQGEAQVRDFELFVRCQQELSRRTWN